MLTAPSLFYGWIVTACAFLVLFLTYGIQYSFGVFLPFMLDELGWRRADIAGAFSLYTMVYSACSWFSGRFTDSKGPQVVIAIGGLLLGCGIMATSQVSAKWQMYIFYGFIAAFGMSTAFIPCNTTVVKWFQRKRGLALGLASSGSSSGILTCPPLAAALIASYGWRPVYFGCGVVILVALNIIARFMVRSPELLGLVPDGDPVIAPTQREEEVRHSRAGGNPGEEEGAASFVSEQPDGVNRVSSYSLARQDSTLLTGWSLQEAWGFSSFWLLGLVFVIMLLTVPVPFVHIVAFARDLGFSSTQGALAVSIMGLCSFIGSLTLGPLSDRIGRKQGLLISLVIHVIAYVLFFSTQSLVTLYCGAAAFGFFYGSMATLFSALVGDYFGRRHAGAIAGFLFAAAGVFGAWGPMIAGYLRDTTGSYHLAFTCAVATSLVALLLFVVTPKPPAYNEKLRVENEE
ncbi:MAG: MFS transporter [Candidatus Binatia bacterium]